MDRRRMKRIVIVVLENFLVHSFSFLLFVMFDIMLEKHLFDTKLRFCMLQVIHIQWDRVIGIIDKVN